MNITIYLLMAVSLLSGILFGYDTAVINGANQYLKEYFSLSTAAEGTAAASAILGCIPGALFAGFFSDRSGRRGVLFACAVFFTLSAIFTAFSYHFSIFLLARFLGGIGIGTASMICPVYTAESAPAHLRGRLGSLFQFGIVSGILFTLFSNALIQGFGDHTWNLTIGWRIMFGLGGIPAIALFLVLFRAPESPRWLLLHGHDTSKKAESMDSEQMASSEQTSVSPHNTEGRLGELFQKRLKYPLLIAVGLAILSQLSGINALMYYSTKIFIASGTGVENAFQSSVAVGCINFTFTMVAVFFVDRMGRRPLLLIGTLVQFLALTAVAIMFHAQISGLPLLVATLVFIAFFAIAMGPIPWIIGSEIFPSALRGRAMSLATFSLWGTCYFVTQTFPLLNDSPFIGPAKTFAVFALCSLVSFVFVYIFVPETKGRSLEEIESFWK